MSLNAQFLTMAAMALSGAGLGFMFDVYRVLSNELRCPRWLIPPLDLLFWSAGTLAVFRVLLVSNGGEVRMYIFLALMIGICFYFGLLSGLLVMVLRWIVIRIKELIRFVIKLIEWLVIRPLILLYRLVYIFFGFLLTLSIFLYKIMLQLVYSLWKFSFWIIRPVAERVYRFIQADRWLTPHAKRLIRWVRQWKK